MGWTALAALGLVACSFHGASETPVDAAGAGSDGSTTHDAAPEAWLTGFAHRKHIVIDAGMATLADFPVSIVEASDPDLAASARADGGDLVFTGADAVTPINWELVAWDPSMGSIEAWVNVTLAGAPIDVYLYYGGPATPSKQSAWPASTMAVYHMATAGSMVRDSSGHGHTAMIEASLSAPGPGDGIIGACRSYDGEGDTMQVADAGDLDAGTDSFSYALWVNVPASVGSFDMPLNKGGETSGSRGYDIELGTGGWNASIADGDAEVFANFGPETLNQWVYLVAVIDRGRNAFTGYLDAIPGVEADITGLGSLSSSAPLQLGIDQLYFFNGLLDEITIYRTALTNDWITASYLNVTHRSTFVTIGPPTSE